MKNSCGAIFYTYDDSGNIGVILGEEDKNEWLPFKGCSHENETLEEAAIREIKEETCGLLELNEIVLEHKFSSKRKNYFIGLCYAPYAIISQFDEKIKNETRKEFKEKKKLKFVALENILYIPEIHSLSKASIEYYWDRLNNLRNKSDKDYFIRYHGISHNYASEICKRAERELNKNRNAELSNIVIKNKKYNMLMEKHTNNKRYHYKNIRYMPNEKRRNEIISKFSPQTKYF